MNARDWEKLKKNWKDLLDVYPSSVIPHLYQKDVLSPPEKKKVESSGISYEQMNTLLEILRQKPPKKEAFRFLLEALETDNQDLARKIKETEAKSDPSLTSSVDPHLLDDDVRQVLLNNFSSKASSSLAISEIRACLKSEGVFSGGQEWSNEILESFVKKEFQGVESENRRKRTRSNIRKEIYFKNIARHKLDAIKPQPELDMPPCPESLKEHQSVVHIETLTAPELRKYLQPQFEKKQMPTEALDELEREGIIGEVFLSMTEEDFKQTLKSANFATCRKLKMIIDEYSHAEVFKVSQEYLRAFDTDIKHTDKYIKGRLADVTVNARGKKTTPIKNFHLLPEHQDKDRSLEFIGSEVIPFASACLNNRRNGTIYFGISPRNDGQYKTGEIIGVNLLKDEVRAEIGDCIKASFSSLQTNCVSSSVREARFVPVVTGKQQCSDLFVIEVDINPSCFMQDTAPIRTKLTRLPIFAKKNRSKDAVFQFSEQGFPKIVSSDEMYTLERDQPRFVEQRREEEAQMRAEPKPNLRVKLLNLLTGGTETLQDDIFIFMMTSSVDKHMDMDYLSKTVPFIKHLHPEVVFDFDGTGSKDGIYKNLDECQEEPMRVSTTDDFDTDSVSKDHFKTLTSDLANENHISWVFCNGYEDMSLEPLNPTDWNRRRRNAFQECLKFYTENFGRERILILIFLFSKDYDSMISACDEVLLKLPEKWIVLAESEDHVKPFQDQLLSRNIVEKRELSDRCVVGMPWEQVNSTVIDAKGERMGYECQLPTSTGAFTEVREKKLKDWCDVYVLSASEPALQESERKKKEKEVEEQFYKGGQVDWFNFFFHDQVLKRKIHNRLEETVKEKLAGRGKEVEDKVTVALIYHQPGAGGTTSAKQILWEMRKTYRCCVVNTITDQTCDQLDEIRLFKETAPKPLLILIDNEDEEKSLQLKNSLEIKGRQRSSLGDESFDVYCTIIFCIRRASLPQSLTRGNIALRQQLVPQELQWFMTKHENLTQRYKKDKKKNIDPQFLLSFNILRENFNKEYVAKVVKEFTDAVKLDKEVTLLKVVSLLNTYDLNCKPIPISCLDTIFETKMSVKSRSQYTRATHSKSSRCVRWEAKLSQSVKVLLDLSSNKYQSGKKRTCVRVFNKVIAEEILKRIKEHTGQVESEMMLELMQLEIFENDSLSSKQLMTLIANVIKQRKFQENGRGKLKFSSFVFYVKENEGAEVAAKVLVQLFELNQDPFTAQLIARFYIDIKNWDLAEEYAKKATTMLPSNSFLWDTCGQVFKNQLQEKMDSMKTMDRADAFKDSEMKKLITLTGKCLDAFKRSQQLSEYEETTNEEINFAGYFGELRAILIFFSVLHMCPSLTDNAVLQRFLVGQTSTPEELSFLTEDDLNFLKSLEKSANEAMRRLDEEFLQIKGSSNQEMPVMTHTFEFNKDALIGLKVNLDEYFGKPSADVLSQTDKCQYRLRHARQMGSTSQSTLLNLMKTKQFEDLHKIYSLLHKNVKSGSKTFFDLLSLMNTVTVLLVCGRSGRLDDLNFNNILQWSKRLYTFNNEHTTNRSYLETFLYYVMYNFPTEERLQSHELCLATDLSTAIDKWLKAFRNNYPKHVQERGSLRKRETTLFFLGNGPPLQDIVHHDSLVEMENLPLTEKWELPALRRKLKLMTGTLTDRGSKVKFNLTSKEGNKFPLQILTSHPVRNRSMWQKKVYFYLGFSFAGPKAFGMSLTELGTCKETPQHSKSTFRPSTARVTQPSSETRLLSEWLVKEQEIKSTIEKLNPRDDSVQIKKLERKLMDVTKAKENLIGN